MENQKEIKDLSEITGTNNANAAAVLNELRESFISLAMENQRSEYPTEYDYSAALGGLDILKNIINYLNGKE